jgi:hypothetical protein
MALAALTVASGILQVLGYLLYIQKSLRNEIEPNPTSWLMFAYGTTLLTFLEWDLGAGWQLLTVPTLCAACSAFVAFGCCSFTGRLVPTDKLDRLSLGLDLLLTFSYGSGWLLFGHSLIDSGQKETIDLFLLICWNVGILTSFAPLLRQNYAHAEREQPLPWAVWTGAYATLSVITMQQKGVNALLLYPVLNTLVHGYVACHSGPRAARQNVPH